jgi:hypothetical protein
MGQGGFIASLCSSPKSFGDRAGKCKNLARENTRALMWAFLRTSLLTCHWWPECCLRPSLILVPRGCLWSFWLCLEDPRPSTGERHCPHRSQPIKGKLPSVCRRNCLLFFIQGTSEKYISTGSTSPNAHFHNEKLVGTIFNLVEKARILTGRADEKIASKIL